MGHGVLVILGRGDTLGGKACNSILQICNTKSLRPLSSKLRLLRGPPSHYKNARVAAAAKVPLAAASTSLGLIEKEEALPPWGGKGGQLKRKGGACHFRRMAQPTCMLPSAAQQKDSKVL